MVRLWDAQIHMYFKRPWSLLSPAFQPVPSPGWILTTWHSWSQDASTAQPVQSAIISSARLNWVAAESRLNPEGFLGASHGSHA